MGGWMDGFWFDDCVMGEMMGFLLGGWVVVWTEECLDG
jgi:hypothetical protein